MRIITAKVEKIIDDKLKNNGGYIQAINTKDARAVMMYAAEALVGTKESGGNNKGDIVVELQKTVDNTAGQEPWCMAYVQTCIAYAEKKTGVKSLIPSSEHCMTTFRNTPKENKVKLYPAYGAIIIWKQKKSDSGHTGFVVEYNSDSKIKSFESVEGNTGSGSMFDGDGIYFRTRNKVSDGSLIIQGYLIPFPAYKKPVVIDVKPTSIRLAWEPKLNNFVSDHLLNGITENLPVLSSAKDLETIFPGFSKLSIDNKVQVIAHFLVALAKFESSYNPKSYSVDVGTKNDKGSWSVGLYQLSANDNSAKKFKATFETLQDPKVNITVMLEQMTKQIKKEGLFILPNTSPMRYWAIILKNNKYNKIESVLAEVKNNYKELGI